VPSGGYFVEWYALFSFDLSSIPSAATIVSAELRVFLSAFEGTPFSNGNTLLLKHVIHPEPPSFRKYTTLQTVIKPTVQSQSTLDHDVKAWVAADLPNGPEQSHRSQYVFDMSKISSDRISITFDRGSAGLYIVYEQ